MLDLMFHNIWDVILPNFPLTFIFFRGLGTPPSRISWDFERRASPLPAAKQMSTVMVDDALPPCGAQGHVRNF